MTTLDLLCLTILVYTTEVSLWETQENHQIHENHKKSKGSEMVTLTYRVKHTQGDE